MNLTFGFCFRFNWTGDPFSGLWLHLRRLWDNHHHAVPHLLQPGHKPWCNAHPAGRNRCQPAKRCDSPSLVSDILSIEKASIQFSSFDFLGSNLIWETERAGVPGPSSLWVTAFDSPCSCTWQGVQKDHTDPWYHHPRGGGGWDSCASSPHGPAVLGLSWAFQTREVKRTEIDWKFVSSKLRVCRANSEETSFILKSSWFEIIIWSLQVQ